MEWYKVALFLHIIGVIGLLFGVGLAHLGLHNAQRAKSVQEMRPWVGLAARADRLIPLVALMILGAGIFMVQDQWAWDVAWIDVSFGFFLAMLVLGPAVNARAFDALHKAAEAAQDGPIAPELAARLWDPVLNTLPNAMTLSVFGIVWLMTTQPGPVQVALTMIVSLAMGVVVSLPALRRSAGREAAPSASAAAGRELPEPLESLAD